MGFSWWTPRIWRGDHWLRRAWDLGGDWFEGQRAQHCRCHQWRLYWTGQALHNNVCCLRVGGSQPTATGKHGVMWPRSWSFVVRIGWGWLRCSRTAPRARQVRGVGLEDSGRGQAFQLWRALLAYSEPTEAIIDLRILEHYHSRSIVGVVG